MAGLFGRLVLPFRADGVFDRLSARGQHVVELLVQCRGRRAERARALQQARDEGVVDVGPATADAVRARLDRRLASRSAASRCTRLSASTSPRARR